MITRYAIHHFSRMKEAAQDLSHILRHHGHILISDPARNPKDSNHVIDQFMKVKGDGHITFYQPEEIEELFLPYQVKKEIYMR